MDKRGEERETEGEDSTREGGEETRGVEMRDGRSRE